MPSFADDSGRSSQDSTIPWEKPKSNAEQGGGTAKASHHHHVEMMPTSHTHPWHYCHPPPSCPLPAPFAYRAFNGACLGPVNPESLSPLMAAGSTTSSTFSWRHEGSTADCSQRKIAREAKHAAKVRAKEKEKNAKKGYYTGDCRPRFPGPRVESGDPYTSSEDEDSGCQGMLTRSGLHHTTKYA